MDKCINQIFRQEKPVRMEGQGDCKICTSHVDNWNCSQYTPIKITISGFNVEDDQNERKD